MKSRNSITPSEKWMEDRIKQHKKYIKTDGKRGKRLVLVGKELKNYNFNRLNLLGVKFNGSDLTKANFKGCGLVGSDFSRCDLTNAMFWGANLECVKGNGKEIKNIDGLKHSIVYTNTRLWIGHVQFPIEVWKSFNTDDVKFFMRYFGSFWDNNKFFIFDRIANDPAK